MNLYSIVLALHSWARWLVVILALVAVTRALFGWFGKRPWQALDDRAGMLFTIVLDVQLLLGLLLYFVFSPITTQALGNFGAAMRDSATRFWAVEHIFLMIVGVVLAHVGRALSRKASDAVSKHKRAAIFFGLAILAILMAIPWPFLANARPLFRF